MGVRDLFGRLFGPISSTREKEGPYFYRALLADVGATPDRAIVVDDSPRAVGWASDFGSLAELPAALAGLGA